MHDSIIYYWHTPSIHWYKCLHGMAWRTITKWGCYVEAYQKVTDGAGSPGRGAFHCRVTKVLSSLFLWVAPACNMYIYCYSNSIIPHEHVQSVYIYYTSSHAGAYPYIGHGLWYFPPFPPPCRYREWVHAQCWEQTSRVLRTAKTKWPRFRQLWSHAILHNYDSICYVWVFLRVIHRKVWSAIVSVDPDPQSYQQMHH